MNPDDIIKMLMGGQLRANPVTGFEKVLPYQQYMDAINANAIAQNAINPEAAYNRTNTISQYGNTAGANQGYRSGNYFSNQGNIVDQLDRQRLQDIGTYQGAVEKKFTDLYTALSDKYFKDPNLDTMGLISPFVNSNPQPVQQPAQPGQPLPQNNPMGIKSQVHQGVYLGPKPLTQGQNSTQQQSPYYLPLPQTQLTGSNGGVMTGGQNYF